MVFDRVKELYSRLRTEGRKGAVKAAREAQRAAREHAEAAGRRPLGAD